MSFKPYHEVFAGHEGYLSDKWCQHLFIYDMLLSRFCQGGKPVSLLEIGVQNGGSLENWKKYLPEGSQIHGIDINPKCADLKFSDGITFYLGNATDARFLNESFKDLTFDIIIDDGSHICGEVVAAFTQLFPRLNPGGVFIIEDMHTSYWKEYGGSFRRKTSSIEFFKKFIDTLNFHHIRKFGWHSQEEIELVSKFKESISRVSFFDSVCAVEKFYLPKLNSFDQVFGGTDVNVIQIQEKAAVTQEQVQKCIAETKKMFLGE